jgi:hypothetical protein
VSLDAAETGRTWFVAVRRQSIGTALLYPSLTCHMGLALHAVYARRHFRLPLWERLRLGLGLLIQLQLLSLPHSLGSTALRDDPSDLSLEPTGGRDEGNERARCQPPGRDPPCVGVRRSRPLLDLPDPDRGRLQIRAEAVVR